MVFKLCLHFDEYLIYEQNKWFGNSVTLDSKSKKRTKTGNCFSWSFLT